MVAGRARSAVGVPLVLITMLVTCLGTACGAGGAGGGTGGRLAVVAAENVWGDIAAQIGGDRVSVTSILSDPNADPHSYETNPRDGSAISDASVVIENGAGYDDFIDKLLSAGSSSGRDVVNLAAVVGATGNNPNPHLWYNPVDVAAAARAIEAHLAMHEPADSAAFSANLQSFLAAYQPYIDTLQTIRTRHGGEPVGYTERVAGYLVDAAGLHLATPASFAQAIEDGSDPSPADTQAMDGAVQGRAIRVLLYNSQVTSPATESVKQLAIAAGIPVVGVAETIPAGQSSFQAWQIGQAQSILAALGG